MSDESRPIADASLPVIPLRDTVVFPRALRPLTLGRGPTLQALQSLDGHDVVVLVAQRDPKKEDPVGLADVYGVGVTARVLKVAPMPEQKQVVAIVLGVDRVRIVDATQTEPFLRAKVEVLSSILPSETDRELVPLTESVRDLFAQIVAESPFLPNEIITGLQEVQDPDALADLVASLLPSLTTAARQELLGILDVKARLRLLNEELIKEHENLRIRKRIQEEVEQKLGKAQEEFFLREQMKAIQRRLGETDETQRQLEEVRSKVAAAHMPEAVRAEAEREMKRLEHIPEAAAEYSVARTYLDLLAALPWSVTSAEAVDVGRAQEILDEDHYGLEKVKERIVEYLAVLQLRRDLKGPILCFVGPPGVGKTSVGKSIARATGRKFVRISLGGIRDEAEIRGHRRTYVGALPGQIIEGIRRAGTMDPVFMLDEIDKVGKDFLGDPAAALMEVLDPEQNAAFRDHYLDVPFDLSKVLFITTANVLDPVPPALLDRMEILELPGYTDFEKLQIAKKYLVPRQVKEHGLSAGDGIAFGDEALRKIIGSYTHEAGVRNLEREIGALCRKQARIVAGGDHARVTVTPDVVRARLGAPRFHVETQLAERTKNPGVAVAIAWTPQGGDVLFIEAAKMPRDKGEVTLTGQLGSVMQESAKAALSWVRANGERYGVARDAFKECDLHVHVPSGAVPKDGPSAGVVMVAALVSLFTARPLRPYVALTGEITLSGQVLPVGGIKEKVLAAKRSGVREVVLPAQNEPNVLEDLPGELRQGMQFHFVSTIDEALARAFAQDRVMPAPQASGNGGRRDASPALTKN
jgi:ATP-dependent Lon protease